MLQREEQFKVQLAGLEKDLLEALATSSGDLLENQVLIDSLTATKVKSAEISIALKESADASEEIDRQREAYRPFGRDASKIFFLVQSLQKTDHMYQFSLASFLMMFQYTLKGIYLLSLSFLFLFFFFPLFLSLYLSISYIYICIERCDNKIVVSRGKSGVINPSLRKKSFIFRE